MYRAAFAAPSCPKPLVEVQAALDLKPVTDKGGTRFVLQLRVPYRLALISCCVLSRQPRLHSNRPGSGQLVLARPSQFPSQFTPVQPRYPCVNRRYIRTTANTGTGRERIGTDLESARAP
jgi:hypothetical protein